MLNIFKVNYRIGAKRVKTTTMVDLISDNGCFV